MLRDDKSRRHYLGLFALAATGVLTGCLDGNGDDDVDEADADIVATYNVEVLPEVEHPEAPGNVVTSPHAVFVVEIENRMDEPVDGPGLVKPDEGLLAWNTFGEILGGGSERGYLIYTADNLEAEPELITLTDEYDVYIERNESLEVDVGPADAGDE